MKRIFKYQLAVVDEQEVLLPKSSEILTVQEQSGSPCLWALVEDNQPLESRRLRIYGTGHPMDEDGVYLGTFHMEFGQLVFHVFEV